jgi:CheY-like chemotaxis protein
MTIQRHPPPASSTTPAASIAGASRSAAAPSAEQALTMLGQARHDLMLCDLALPGMDGLQLLDALHALAAPPKCIVLSNHDDPAHVLAALNKGALAYLVKPLRLPALRDLVSRHFESGVPAGQTRAQPAGRRLLPRDTGPGRLSMERLRAMLDRRPVLRIRATRCRPLAG